MCRQELVGGGSEAKANQKMEKEMMKRLMKIKMKKKKERLMKLLTPQLLIR